jgi:OmpA-OmpF porin, OOP family
MKRLLFPVAAAALLASCSMLPGGLGASNTAAVRCRRPEGMELIIGSHRAAPRPSLGPALVCQLAAAIRAGKPVRIVVASGQPRLIDPRLISVTGGTLAEQGSPRVQEDVQRVQAAVAAARPESPGVDDLAALALAADEARSLGAVHAELVLIDSGLDDRGALDFRVPGMLAASPAEVAHELEVSGNLPSLHGLTVVLVSTGYTAPPQEPLSAKWRATVTEIWTAVVRAAGASVRVIPQPGQGPSVATEEPVLTVPVPSIQSVRPGKDITISLTQESPVRFEPNSTAFVDLAAAAQALTPIARWLQGYPSRHAALEGTTADVGPMSGQIALSRARADRVRSELIMLGASAAQVTAIGVGSDFPQFRHDRNAEGTLLPGLAALNRSVRITLS